MLTPALEARILAKTQQRPRRQHALGCDGSSTHAPASACS